MADSSLDDFFAKKDKSKKKSKSSKLTPGDILAKSEEPAKIKKEKKSKKERDKSPGGTDSTNNNPVLLNEGDWKEVEEEEEKDYSGLRIANIQISEKDVEAGEDDGREDVADDDEDGEVKDRKDGGKKKPWKPSGAAPGPAPVPVEEQPKPKEEAPAPKTTGKYVPPGQRAGASGATSGVTVPAHLRKKKAAPNITSEDDFPTLGGGSPSMPVDSDTRSFERVQYGGRQMGDLTKSSQQLSLGNKYSALQD